MESLLRTTSIGDSARGARRPFHLKRNKTTSPPVAEPLIARELLASFPHLAFRLDTAERIRDVNQGQSSLFIRYPMPGSRLEDVVDATTLAAVRSAVGTARGIGFGTTELDTLTIRARRFWSLEEHLVSIEPVEQQAIQLEPIDFELIKDKTSFLASVSHHLRTPLTAVLGYADLLSDPAAVTDDTTRTQMLRTLTEQAWHLAGVVEDLMAAARLETGELITVKVQSDLDANVRQILEAMGKQGSRVIFNPAGNAIAAGDPARIRQIIRNLVSNAVIHGVPPIQLQTRRDQNGCTLAVIDHGPGVPEEDVDTIFDQYTSVSTHLIGPSGVGIGLWISRVLANMMDGDLTYHRANNQTIFALTLPVPALPPA